MSEWMRVVVNSQEAAEASQRPKAVLLAVCNSLRSSLSMVVNGLRLLATVGKVNRNEESAAKKKSALYSLLDYIVRTDTIPEKSALKIIKMIDNRDFPMDFVGGTEPLLDYEEILQKEREELEHEALLSR